VAWPGTTDIGTTGSEQLGERVIGRGAECRAGRGRDEEQADEEQARQRGWTLAGYGVSAEAAGDDHAPQSNPGVSASRNGLCGKPAQTTINFRSRGAQCQVLPFACRLRERAWLFEGRHGEVAAHQPLPGRAPARSRA
jgi:hypothetical protein